MKIAFYANHPTWGQLRNNGGTKTILRSAETLRDLGHDVDVVANSDKFTYFKHPKPVKKIPKCDVCIAVSPTDIPPMVKELPSGVKMAVWLRGWPVWAVGSDRIVFLLKTFADAGHDVFTISKWLEKKCAKKGIKTKLQYAGYDHLWTTGKNCINTIGVLYHKFHKTKNYEFWTIVKRSLGDDYHYREIGHEPMNGVGLMKVYQECGIWFAPTALEGFHQVPMEANLCGALVVCSNHPRNGMDYAIQSNAMIYEYGDVNDAVKKIRNARFEKAAWMREYIRTNIGTRKENMEKFVEALNVSG